MATSIFYKFGELSLEHAKENGSELIIDKQLDIAIEAKTKQKIQKSENDEKGVSDEQNAEEFDDQKDEKLALPSRNRERPNIIDKPSRHRSSQEMPTKKRSTFEMNPVSYRFKRFIEEEVGEASLYNLFVDSHYDDIRMIEYFTDSMLKQEIGIKDQLLRKLFLAH